MAVTQVSINDDITGIDSDRDGDGITYSCYWDTSDNDTVALTNQCFTGGTQLPGSGTLTAAGVFDWTPDHTASGTYEVRIYADEGDLNDSTYFT